MRILLTGHAGFIGYHLAEALLARGDDVLGIDNFNDYYPVQIKRQRSERLTRHGVFREVELDLAVEGAVEREVAGFEPNVVVNLAAQAGVRYSLTNPRAYIRANLIAFEEVLEACRHHGKPRLVYASSSSVYGGNERVPFRVDDPVDRPISLYAATKKANELMAHTYTHLFDVQTIGLRFFTVYGPWARPDHAFWIFSEAMRAGRPLPVFNHGKMQRDVTYVDDIVAGLLACIDRPDLPAYRVYNLGNDKPVELMEMIRLLAEAIGETPTFDFKGMQPGDVPSTWADIQTSRDELGYAPQTDLDVGVKHFAKWFLDHPELEAPVAQWRKSQR